VTDRADGLRPSNNAEELLFATTVRRRPFHLQANGSSVPPMAKID